LELGMIPDLVPEPLGAELDASRWKVTGEQSSYITQVLQARGLDTGRRTGDLPGMDEIFWYA